MSPHLARIDALRGVAILMVMQLHIFFITFAYDYLNLPAAARYLLRSGGAGVDLFFILSAYLLTTNLLRQRDRPGVITTFFARRALRILPMFLILIFGGFAIEALWLKAGGTTDVWLWHDHYPLSTYLLFLQNWRLGLDGHWSAQFFAPTWSLAVEEHFYLLLPLIATRLEPRRLAIVAIAWILLAAPTRIFVLLEFGGIAPTTWTIARLDAFGWGILIALAPNLWPSLAKRFDARLAIGAGSALFVIVVLFAPYLLPGGRNDSVFGPTWVDLAMALVTFGVVNHTGEPRQAGPVMRWFAWCGERCYSLYLVHFPMLGLIFLASGRIQKPRVDGLSTLSLALLAAGLAFIIADVCYRRIERPFMALAGRFAPHRDLVAETIAIPAAE
jgi:peptidoglycan/LPS O-acetylase OafA/YrhL